MDLPLREDDTPGVNRWSELILDFKLCLLQPVEYIKYIVSMWIREHNNSNYEDS